MCPSFFFGYPLYNIISFLVVLNSSLSKCPAACVRHFEMSEFPFSPLCKPPRNVTRAQHFTAFIEHEHCIKTYPIQTNSVSFHELKVYKRQYICLSRSSKMCPIIALSGGARTFLMLFKIHGFVSSA